MDGTYASALPIGRDGLRRPHLAARDARLRALLYEAAVVILTRVHQKSALRSWGLALWKKLGFKRAAVAVARKLAVILHTMWKTGKDFDRAAGTVTTTTA